VGAAVALWTSVRAVAANPFTMAVWGLIVAVSLTIGSLPFFFGLAIVVPILGHSTWHLYRRVVEIPEKIQGFQEDNASASGLDGAGVAVPGSRPTRLAGLAVGRLPLHRPPAS